MKYINHITLNSGHMRKTYPSEVNKAVYFHLKRIYNDSLKGHAEVFEGFTAKTTRTIIGTVTTVFAEEKLPVLTVACSKLDQGELWSGLHETASTPLVTKANAEPPTPYIADRLELGAAMHTQAMQWTGDFSRCLGWVVLNPRKIR